MSSANLFDRHYDLVQFCHGSFMKNLCCTFKVKLTGHKCDSSCNKPGPNTYFMPHFTFDYLKIKLKLKNYLKPW